MIITFQISQGLGKKIMTNSFHREFLYKIDHHAEPLASGFQKALGALDRTEKKKLLLTPLSGQMPETALSYIIADRYADNHQWRAAFLTVALDEIEKLDVPAAERLAVFEGANELGQTVFHKALRTDTNQDLFGILEERLRKWGGNDYADAYMRRFRSEPLGVIDKEASALLKMAHNSIRPYDSDEYRLLGALCEGTYQPATYKGLKATIDNKVRPLIQKMHPRLKPDGMAAAAVERHRLLGEFARNANAVKKVSKAGAYIEEQANPKKPSRWRKFSLKKLFR
jgi:hypothetical protein